MSDTEQPGPRDGLDEGTLSDLATDSALVPLDPPAARPALASSFGLIDVPDDASALVDGLAAYGS